MGIFSRLRALESYQRNLEEDRLQVLLRLEALAQDPQWLHEFRAQIDGLRIVHSHLASVQANLESRTDELEAERRKSSLRSRKGA